MEKHKRFERRGNDLHMKTTITLREALLGFTKTVRHMDGHTLEITTSGVTQHLQVIKVKGEGMPLRDDPQSFGNLYVKVDVVFPKKISEERQKMVAKLLPETPSRAEL